MAKLMNDSELKILADKIKDKLRKNFEEVHLSGNLMDTITVNRSVNGFEIDIPAKMYDLAIYKDTKSLIYKGVGSYAQEVNVQGGFSGKHVNYVEKAINEAIEEWLKNQEINGKVVGTL